MLGTPALFATAYGNVGSSIYYALGLTAAYALGLTPLVFVVAGIIFAATAATYAEGTARYPEAGGSASFARHAFDELVSFVAAWAQMLVYIVTVAVSAFFVPHYLSIFWEPLRTNPWDIVGGIVVIVVLVSLNVVGVQEAAKLSVTLAVVDFATQLLLVAIGFALVLSPEVARRQRALGDRADVAEPGGLDPGRDARLHRGGDRLQPRRGGARPRAHGAERVQARRPRRLRHLLHAAARRALGAAGGGDRRRADDPPRAARPRRAASPTTRSSASSRTSASKGRCSTRQRSTSASSRRRSSSSPRTRASSEPRASPTRWRATASCRRRSAACTRG